MEMTDSTITEAFSNLDTDPVTSEPDPESKVKKPRKTGKRAGPVSATPRKPRVKKSDQDLSTAIYTVGAMIAGILGKPELALTEPETKMLGEAANKVAGYYELPDMGLTGAWVNLGICIGAVVLPRWQIIKDEMKVEKEETES